MLFAPFLLGCVQAVCRVYHQHGCPTSHLEGGASELVEVLSCYFPVTFTPPKNDTHGITRQVGPVGDCVSCLPALACAACRLACQIVVFW